jgi:hypothetical protein
MPETPRFRPEDIKATNLSREQKQEAVGELHDRFNKQEIQEIKRVERAKTPDERKMIALVNHETNQLLKSFDIEPIEVSENNVHVIPQKYWYNEVGGGYYDGDQQAVALTEQNSRLGFSHMLFHEMVHMKSYQSFYADDKGKPTGPQRVGLSYLKKGPKKQFFRALNEAVTEELAVRFTEAIKNLPFFESESKRTQEMRKTT